MEPKRPTGQPTIFGRVSLDTVHIKAGKWKYLVIARDDLSGWVEAVGLEKIQAKKISQWFLESWIYRYGAPWTVTVDGGSEFGQQFQKTLKEAGIIIKVTTPYYPEANGMIERGHQSIKDALIKLCGQDGKRWRNYLPLVLFADRISTKRTTGHSPYELVLGQPPILPI
jgi:transposase-like protein